MSLEQLQEEIKTILSRVEKPKKALITAGMPYANGPLHVGHLAGAQVPADIFSRYLKLLIGKENVLFVNGNDDHGSTSELAAAKANKPVREFIDEIHEMQSKTIDLYSIGLDIFTGTSQPENYEGHKEYCQEFLRKLHANNMLDKKISQQWYDVEHQLFLPDRYVFGTCPNCGYDKAYSEECDGCGTQYEASELKDPKSTLSDSAPVLKETVHWYLNMWKVIDQLKEWLDSKSRTWRKSILMEVMPNVHPTLLFSNKSEAVFKELKEVLPENKSRYAPGKKIAVSFNSLSELVQGRKILEEKGVECELLDGWAHRSITRDVKWGIPVPYDIDGSMEGKTFYVWPESLIAPISFTKLALKKMGKDENQYKEYWSDSEAKVYQFLGQDNVFFYVLMQGAMWLGTQENPLRQPIHGELQMTEIFSSYHLHIDGAKMSKSTGNYYTADQLIYEMGYHPDQVRYFLALLSLAEKNSNLDFETFKERNKFLAGPLNAALEKPISACHSKFDGKIPDGELIGKVEKETKKIIQHYVNMMKKAEYSKVLFAVENYARIINGLFNQYRPHDDRHDMKERSDALYSSFFVLKNLLIMLSPFVPQTMEKLRISLNLPESVYSIYELGKPIVAGNEIGEQVEYFPAVND